MYVYLPVNIEESKLAIMLKTIRYMCIFYI